MESFPVINFGKSKIILYKTDRDGPLACSIVKQIATWIGAAVINTIHIIGPQTVFVGGKIAVLGDALIQPIREIVSIYLFGDQKVDVRLSEISENAVAIGAAIYITTKWLEKKSTERVIY